LLLATVLRFDPCSVGRGQVKVVFDDDLLARAGFEIDRLAEGARLVEPLEVDPVEGRQQGQQLDDVYNVSDCLGSIFEPASGVQGGELNTSRIWNNSLTRNLLEVFVRQLLKANVLEEEQFDLKMLEKNFSEL